MKGKQSFLTLFFLIVIGIAGYIIVSQVNGSGGRALFRRTCSQCHQLPNPESHTAEQWPRIVKRMVDHLQYGGKHLITERRKEKIITYLEDHSRP